MVFECSWMTTDLPGTGLYRKDKGVIIKKIYRRHRRHMRFTATEGAQLWIGCSRATFEDVVNVERSTRYQLCFDNIGEPLPCVWNTQSIISICVVARDAILWFYVSKAWARKKRKILIFRDIVTYPIFSNSIYSKFIKTFPYDL